MLEEGRQTSRNDDDHSSCGSHNHPPPPNSPTIARIPPESSPSSPTSPVTVGSKRNREGGGGGGSGGKFASLRRSIFRVGSRTDRSGRGDAAAFRDAVNGVPHSPRARASTYSHVHDAVMYNLSEAETSKHDQSVPMGELWRTCK
jgi:hypothetical protein